MADLLGTGLNPAGDPALMQARTAGVGRMSRTVLDQLRSGSRGADPTATRQALRQASQEFEAVFLNQMVSAMRKTVGEGGLIDKGQGEKVFEGMLDEEYARQLAGRSGPGSLSDLIYRQLSRRMGLEPEAIPTTARSDASPGAAAGHPLLLSTSATPPAGLLTPERDR